MPPWVSRQWHALGVSRACRLSLRSYAQKSNAIHNAYDSAIIIPSSVAAAPADIIPHIQPIKQFFSKDRLAVFLLTPAFATWLLDDNTFVKRALEKLTVPKSKPRGLSFLKIHALCAVVDKLPTPQQVQNVQVIEEDALRRTKNPSTWDSGHEGVAYAILRNSNSIPSTQPATDEGGSITFRTSGVIEDGMRHGDTIRLPLANTIFQTGSPTTMIYSTWHRKQDTTELILQSRQKLTHHGVQIPGTKAHIKSTSALAIPLVPLCFPRAVTASMGNIIRQIYSAKKESVPASQELESLVPKYFKARGEPSQALAVWALIIPGSALAEVNRASERAIAMPGTESSASPGSELEAWETRWKANPAIYTELVSSALVKGARLHRVLSGGGGWGKKAGLLSLDPRVTSTESESAASQKFSDELDGPGDLSSALQPVVQPGDHIQFLVSPKSPIEDVNDVGVNVERLKHLAGVSPLWKLELGTVPSTIDAVQASSWQHNDSENKDVYVFRETFGALAEGGMSLKQMVNLEVRSLSVDGGTKVDIPFSRFSSVDYVAGNGLGKNKEAESVSGRKVSHDHDSDDSSASGSTSLLDHTAGGHHIMNLDTVKPQPRINSSRSEHSREHLGGKSRPFFSPDVRYLPEEPTTTLHRPFHLPTTSPDTPRPSDPPNIVRRYPISTPYSRYSAAKLRDTQKAVQRLTDDFRSLMVAVRQRYKQRLLDQPIVLRTVMVDTPEWVEVEDNVRDTYEKAARREQAELRMAKKTIVHLHDEVHQLYISVADILARQANLSDARLYATQKDFKMVLDSRTSSVFACSHSRISLISDTILRSRLHLAQVLSFISARTHFIHLTNSSAIDVYHLNILLRWRMARLILKRQQLNYPMSQIAPLERVLVSLRAYRTNLLAHRDGIKQSHILEKLDTWEQQKRELSLVRLSEAGERWQRKLRMGTALIEHEKQRIREVTLRHAIGNKSLNGDHRIRKSLDAARIRLYRRRLAPLVRRCESDSEPIRRMDGLGGVFCQLMDRKEPLVRRHKVRVEKPGVGRLRLRRVAVNSEEYVKRVMRKRFVEEVSGWLGLAGAGGEGKERWVDDGKAHDGGSTDDGYCSVYQGSGYDGRGK